MTTLETLVDDVIVPTPAPPTVQQIAADKQKITEYSNLSINKSLEPGGKTGFGILGIFGFVAVYILYKKMPEVFVFIIAFAAVFCSIYFGFEFIEKVCRKKMQEKQQKFILENNFEEIKSRAAKYPKLYA